MNAMQQQHERQHQHEHFSDSNEISKTWTQITMMNYKLMTMTKVSDIRLRTLSPTIFSLSLDLKFYDVLSMTAILVAMTKPSYAW